MKLRTSFFNPMALYKNITRFWPVWGLYSIGAVIVALIMGENADPYFMPGTFSELITILPVINLFYGTICAVVLFGDLYRSRMCNALHAMPLRREGWYLVHLASGFLFALVPNLGFVLFSAFLLQESFYLAFIALAICMLQFLFFFGLATLCCVCAGSRFAAFTLCAIANFLPQLIQGFLGQLYEPLLYGVRIPTDWLTRFSPVVQMVFRRYFRLTYSDFYGYQWDGFVASGWNYLLIAAAVGVVFLGLGVLVYRKRHLESAGEFLSLRALRPVFLVICTLGAATVFYGFGELFSYSAGYTFLVLGLAVGFFGASMFLNRTVKVFRARTVGGFCLIGLLLAITMTLTALDIGGVTEYIPQAEDVQAVEVNFGNGYEMPSSASGEKIRSSDPQWIDAVCKTHKRLLLQRRSDGVEYAEITIHYTLSDGRTVSRYYPIVPQIDTYEEDPLEALRPHFSSWQCVFGTQDWQALKSSVKYMYCTEFDQEVAGQLQDQLLEAMKADCDAGTMAQPYKLRSEHTIYGWIYIETRSGEYLDICITGNCENTISVLKAIEKGTT